ncbi:MAG TPA: protein kinase, partial [Polyangiaceae bacterium]|nr:protein kinase [Polyangiaceae bacterium]
ANLFLLPVAQAQYDVKVLDFGIAKVMDVAGGMGTKTRTGAVLGTPGYMSPEQVKNAKAVDPRSDLWAVGVVFYEMLTCHHPYGQADQLARMVAVLREPPMPITRFAPHLTAWEPFFHKALERGPEARFQSAEEMAEKLREIAQGAPGRAVPDGVQTMALPTRNVAPTSAMHAAPASAGPVPTAAIPLYHPASSPPPAQHPSHPPPAPPAGARPGSQTQVSETRPVGVPTLHSDIPMVHVTDAAEPEPLSLVWWGVLLVGVGCFALGLMVGYLLAG